MKHVFTEDEIRSIYDEIDRRIRILEFDDYDAKSLREARCDMMQGVYSTLMILAKDWPHVRHMCDLEEERRGYREAVA